ncbi:hypothetical protein BU25DRAFT_448868 [Macroventuria anomochaeta]|uniref:Uncharacterized protein n=1 Tax=Macroventuria anomochaeta TaxID=301207 RepID=A0ACB6RZG1_9PLEO|nr:uncharacterized protein BU25DRAFT_448868 [Macroventuria anomochaeta]KAF2627103.1 hypothetical protein BU25DRAFT_448868 [Macroventuria anomochaeta]
MRTKIIKQTGGKRRVKSRSGCKACKARHIKCDETVPACQQCTKRKVQCPGYAQTFTWSSRHEKFGQGCDRGRTTCFSELFAGDGSLSSTTSTKRAGQEWTSKPTTERSTAWPTDMTSAPPVLESSEQSVSRYNPCIYHHQREEANHTPLELKDSPEQINDLGDPPLALANDDNSLQTCHTSPHQVCLDFWEPSPITDLLLYSPAAELHYFGQTICRHLFICDTINNPMRNVTIAQVRCSALYHALLKYLTAEYLNKTIVADDARHVLQTAKTDTLFHLQRVGVQEASCKASEEILLATMMLGLSASWDGTNNPGVQYYRQAVSLCGRTIASMSRHKRRFYGEALMYWWSGLAFVTDRTKEALPDPPESTSLNCIFQSRGISLHPLTGVSPHSHHLMGQVGALVYTQRKLALDCSFLSSTSMKAQECMLRESQQLEQVLLSLQTPDWEDVDITNDADTPAADLCNIAEAYRLCALLLLYRCFPDLLFNKLALDGVLEQMAAERYMSTSALQALNVIEKNGVTSRTRSVEQLLLVIIAGELRLPNQLCSPPTSVVDRESELLSEPSKTLSLLESIGMFSESERNLFSSTADGSELRATTVEDEVYTETQIILTARALVCTRMSAVRSILPYRSVEQAEELMWDVWFKSDNGEEAFWVDLMIRNCQKFVMV